MKPKKKVRYLIQTAPKGAKISDGVRTWTKEEALKANPLSSILDMDVHSISEGNIYVETHFPGNSRPYIVMAVKIIEE